MKTLMNYIKSDEPSLISLSEKLIINNDIASQPNNADKILKEFCSNAWKPQFSSTDNYMNISKILQSYINKFNFRYDNNKQCVDVRMKIIEFDNKFIHIAKKCELTEKLFTDLTHDNIILEHLAYDDYTSFSIEFLETDKWVLLTFGGEHDYMVAIAGK